MTDHDPNETVEYTGQVPEKNRTVSVVSAGRSNVGLVRKRNEDHYLIATMRRGIAIEDTNVDRSELREKDRQEEGYVFVLADGMGGMASGNEASRLAIVTGWELVNSAPHWHLDFKRKSDIEDLKQTVSDYFNRVNQKVFSEASKDVSREGMGTTLTVAYIADNSVFVIHLGDSRAYLYNQKKLEQITSDHTLAQELAQAGQIKRDDVKKHRYRNVLSRYIGSPDEGVGPQFSQLPLEEGNRLLLCSDGLTDLVDDKVIAQVLANEPTPKGAVDALIDQALQAGGRDNVTVIVANISVRSG